RRRAAPSTAGCSLSRAGGQARLGYQPPTEAREEITMTKPLALSVLLMLASAAALADVPMRSTSTQPRGLPLVGHAAATADPLGSATFVIRDAANAAVSGALVVIDFSACTDVRLSADALEPGFSLDCTNHVIRGIADRNGQVTFHIVGEGNGAGPRALSAC